jgi:adenine-specific DNA-methyltransferase
MNAPGSTPSAIRLSETKDRSLLTFADDLRAKFFARAESKHQKDFAQYLTPPHVADLMADMFCTRSKQIRLLDAGAGMGILSAAFVRSQLQRKVPPKRIDITAYELDAALIQGLEETYAACRIACERRGVAFTATVHHADFIAAASEMQRRDFFSAEPPLFDAAIVNPPYGKLSTGSAGYRLLQAVGMETTNLYSAFLNLIMGLLCPHGELVAITPRSFCNGPYFKPFRLRLINEMSLRRVHVFESRSAAFKHDSVLQENVIIHAVRGTDASRGIRVSQSNGADRGEVQSKTFRTAEIVSPDDPEAFIHLPTSPQDLVARERVSRLHATLSQMGLSISTGRVVDFRVRDNIRQNPGSDTAPLIYPCHFNGLYVTWPTIKGHKPNAICRTDETERLFVSSGVYVLTKRFTSKEERRRVVACIYNPDLVEAPRIGFENHLNYIHADGKGLDMPLAKGLWAYLNSSVLDLYFRQFNGHTQVNATDLRNVRFPTAKQLRTMGESIGDLPLRQDEIDGLVTKELNA